MRKVTEIYAALTLFLNCRPALLGGRVYCEGCHSVGIIAKAGGPRREAFISEVALEGDVVVCHCPKPPALISTLQTTSYNDDGAGTHRAADVGVRHPRDERGGDGALGDITERRLPEPERWDKEARHVL